MRWNHYRLFWLVIFLILVSLYYIFYCYFSSCRFFFKLANEDTPQLYALCGRSARSSLRVLRHGLEVSEMAVSELPGNPNAVWTVRKRADGNFNFVLGSAGVSSVAHFE